MSKINKLGKSTIALAIMSFLLVAVLAFGGTYAYFSAHAGTNETITMGHIHLDGATMGNSKIMTQAFAVPNQTIIDSTSQDGTEGKKKISVTVDSNIAYFVRAIVTAEIDVVYNDATETVMVDHDTNPGTDKVSRIVYHDHGTELPEELEDTHVVCTCEDKGFDVLDITLPDGNDGWVLKSGTSNTESSSKETYTVYKTTKQAGHSAESETTTEHTLNMKVKVNSDIGQNESKHFMDAVITITITFQAVQADYLFVDEDSNPIVAENDYATKIDELVEAWETVYPAA